MNILRIDSSVRVANSKTRLLTNFFFNELAKKKDFKIKTRDVGLYPPSFPTENFITANNTPPSEQTEVMKKVMKPSNDLIDELLWADALVVASPMYNFGISATLKAYIDTIVRIGKTFYIDENGQMKGLLHNKKLLVITSRGAMSYQKGGALEHFDFQENYLRTVFSFMGISDSSFVNAEAQDFGSEDMRKQYLELAKQQLSEIATRW